MPFKPKKLPSPPPKTPIAKVPTTVEPSNIEVNSRTSAEDCIQIAEGANEALTDIATLIDNNDWDAALELLEETVSNLVALRDAMLEAQQKGI